MTRLRLTLVWCPCVLAMAVTLAPAAAAQEPEPLYESRFVEANGIRLQYMDFDGSGLPLIFVQDIHNYFEDEEPYFRDLWSAFYVRFTDDHRVLATVKRGYGESDDPGWGYDVVTQSEDPLELMDALGPGLHPEARLFSTEVQQASADTVHVAPPTGETNSDRANVQAAFDAVQPGGTVLFAPGTYLLGAGARLTVPDVTVLGHPEGTVLRGCDPEAFASDAPQVEIVFGCTGLYVQAERQTIRGLTFEYTWHGIVVGPFPASAEELAALEEGGEPPPAYPAGGQRIEGNTFRATPNGLRVRGTGNELSVVRDNDFIDVFHAIGIYGAPLHFLNNRVTVAGSGSVPFSGHTASAIIVSPGQTDCAGHVVAGNRIEGYPDPIYVLVGRGENCRGVEIRDNTIHAARVRLPEAGPYFEPTGGDSTLVGAPITLMNTMEPIPGVPESGTQGVLEDILVQGNQIVGAEGLGILIQGVSRSRIAGNTITGIERRDPFPGITWDGFEQQWETANGSGIWLSPGSDGNEVVGNVFEDIAADAVVVEGDGNQVELADPADAVRDLGRSNRVRYTTRPGDAVMRGGLTRPSIQLSPDLLPHLLHPTVPLGVDGRHGRVPDQPGSESLEVGR